MKNLLMKMFSFLLLLAASTTMIACTNPHTPAGSEGYVYESPRIIGKGGFQGIVEGPANYGASFLRNEVINIDIRPITHTEKFQILAKDDLNVSFNLHAVIRIKKGSIKEIVENYGGRKWYTRFVREPFRTFVRNSVRQYSSRDLKSQRDVLAGDVEDKLQEYLHGSPLQLIKVVVGDINYPEVVTQAVEKKMAAQQLLEEKATQKDIARKDAEIKVEEAKGIAESQKIINKTLTPNYLQHEAIMASREMAKSPNNTVVYIPSGSNGIPLVNTINPVK